MRDLKRWADARANETITVPAPPSPKNPQMQAPRYTTLAAVLALDDEDDGMSQYTKSDIDQIIDDLMSGDE